MRHSTALYLLQSGVDIAVIALWLGHESIETTHGYIEADLEPSSVLSANWRRPPAESLEFKPGDSLLEFLANI